MPLTVKEKQHWKEQIEKRIEKAIAKAYREEGKDWRMVLQEKANKEAQIRLGLASFMKEHDSLKEKIYDLESKLSELIAVTEKPFRHADENRNRWTRGYDLIKEAINEEATAVEKELLEKNVAGQKILRLMREKEELLDTIWLATSPVQIRSLWKDFTKLVAAEPTELQKQAMTYTPADNE